MPASPATADLQNRVEDEEDGEGRGVNEGRRREGMRQEGRRIRRMTEEGEEDEEEEEMIMITINEVEGEEIKSGEEK